MLRYIDRSLAAVSTRLSRDPRQHIDVAPASEPAPVVASTRQLVRGYDSPQVFHADTLARLRAMEDELASQRRGE